MIRFCASFDKLGIDVDNSPRYTTHPLAKEGIQVAFHFDNFNSEMKAFTQTYKDNIYLDQFTDGVLLKDIFPALG